MKCLSGQQRYYYYIHIEMEDLAISAFSFFITNAFASKNPSRHGSLVSSELLAQLLPRKYQINYVCAAQNLASITYPNQKMRTNVSCLVNQISEIEMGRSYVCMATFSSLVLLPLITRDRLASSHISVADECPGMLVRAMFTIPVQGVLISVSTLTGAVASFFFQNF